MALEELIASEGSGISSKKYLPRAIAYLQDKRPSYGRIEKKIGETLEKVANVVNQNERYHGANPLPSRYSKPSNDNRQKMAVRIYNQAKDIVESIKRYFTSYASSYKEYGASFFVPGEKKEHGRSPAKEKSIGLGDRSPADQLGSLVNDRPKSPFNGETLSRWENPYTSYKILYRLDMISMAAQYGTTGKGPLLPREFVKNFEQAQKKPANDQWIVHTLALESKDKTNVIGLVRSPRDRYDGIDSLRSSAHSRYAA